MADSFWIYTVGTTMSNHQTGSALLESWIVNSASHLTVDPPQKHHAETSRMPTCNQPGVRPTSSVGGPPTPVNGQRVTTWLPELHGRHLESHAHGVPCCEQERTRHEQTRGPLRNSSQVPTKSLEVNGMISWMRNFQPSCKIKAPRPSTRKRHHASSCAIMFTKKQSNRC